jgi:hypothetical protein
MTAYNLLLRKINIPNYTIGEIDNMSQIEIDKLAKLLTMSGNNIENIKNILRYLHKLDDIELVSDIKESILQNLNELEINDINFETLTPNDVINLLKTHRNKALLRRPLYDNMKKIILYNFLHIDYERLGEINYINELSYKLPKSIIFELIEDNEKRLLKNHTVEEINDLIDYLGKMHRGVMNLDIYRDMETLTTFLINLIKINEIGLAKKVFDIANEYNFIATIVHDRYSFNGYLVSILAYQKDDINTVNKLLDFLGEDYLIENFDNIILGRSDTFYIKQLLPVLVKLDRYDLLIKILDLLVIKDYKGSREVINSILPRVKKAIESKNNNLLMKYLNIINLSLDRKLRLGISSILKFDKLIEDAERDEL